MRIIVKPCQSGKTFIKLQQIKDLIYAEKNKIKKGKKDLHLIFTDNSILQTIQLSSRIKGDEGFIDSDSIIFSSKSEECCSLETLEKYIFKNNIKMIISCANLIRFNYINSIIQSYSDKINFYIWIDEADKTVVKDDLLKLISEWNKSYQITFITATPEPLLKVYGEIELVELKRAYDPEKYHRFIDSDFYIIEENDFKDEYPDEELNSVSFAKYILDLFSNEIKKETCWFVPADRTHSSHDHMVELLLDHGFAVILLNATGKKLYIPNNSNEDIDEDPVSIWNIDEYFDTDCEVSTWIGSLYADVIKDRYPFAITGKVCVGRGVTISSPDMIISHAIFPPKVAKRENTYQLAGRICGNTKGWDDYKVPMIFCTNKFYDTVLLMENAAVDIVESGDKIISKNKYIELRGGKKMTEQVDPIIKQINLCDLNEDSWKTEVMDFVKTYYASSKPQKWEKFINERFVKGSDFLHDYLRGKGSKRIYSVDDLLMEKSAGLGKSNKYRINIGYEDLKNHLSGKIIIRILPL